MRVLIRSVQREDGAADLGRHRPIYLLPVRVPEGLCRPRNHRCARRRRGSTAAAGSADAERPDARLQGRLIRKEGGFGLPSFACSGRHRHGQYGARAVLYLTIKAVLSGVIIAVVSEVAKRYPGVGALIASLPLVSVLGMMWL